MIRFAMWFQIAILNVINFVAKLLLTAGIV